MISRHFEIEEKEGEDVLGRQAMSRDIRESSPAEVRVVLIVILGVWVNMVPEVILNSLLLIPGTTEVVAESSRPVGPCNFWGNGLGTANGEDIWAGSWKLRCEFCGVGAVV